MATPPDPLPKSPGTAVPGLDRQYQNLVRERDELSQRLNDALGRLASKDAGAYSLASPGSGPQHDQLVQKFRQLKQQEFQFLGIWLFNLHQENPEKKDKTRPKEGHAFYKAMLTKEILLEGSKLLSFRRTLNSEQDLIAVQKTIHDKIQMLLWKKDPPIADVVNKLIEPINRGIHLLQAMLSAVPPACLLFPRKGADFTPDLHETLPDCPIEGPVEVDVTIFPGYLVSASNRLMEKALVLTKTKAS